MDRINYSEINKMKTTTTEQRFRNFFQERFQKTPENSHGYAEGWVSRINNNSAWVYADTQTRESLRKYFPEQCPEVTE